MNKEEALKRLENINREAEELKKVIEASDSKVWKPMNRGSYWHFSYDMSAPYMAMWHGDSVDLVRYELGNCFKTKEEVLEHAKLVGAFNRLMRSYRAYGYEGKWYPYLSGDGESIQPICYILPGTVSGPFNLLSVDDCQKFIEENKEDLLIFFGVK